MYHVVAYPKIAGATYWWKTADWDVINACYYALCVSLPSWQVGQTSSTVSFNISYCWQTLLAFLVYLGCDLQTRGFAAGRQLLVDTCSPGDACVKKEGWQTCSRTAGEGRAKSQTCVNGATGCVNKLTWLRINVGHSYSHCSWLQVGMRRERWCGVSLMGGDAALLWGPSCSKWSPTC